MGNAAQTIKFFGLTDGATKNRILDNIAKHYGITRDAAYVEVTDEEAESLLDYITGPERGAAMVLMQRHGLRC